MQRFKLYLKYIYIYNSMFLYNIATLKYFFRPSQINDKNFQGVGFAHPELLSWLPHWTIPWRNNSTAYDNPPSKRPSMARVSQNLNEADNGYCFITWTMLILRLILSSDTNLTFLVHRRRDSTLRVDSDTCTQAFDSP